MKISLSHDEFLQYKYKNKSLIRLKVEKLLKNKISNKVLLISSTSIILLLKTQPCFADVDTSKIDVAGNMFLTIIQRAGYWVILIVGITQVIKTAMKGADNSDIFKIVIRYIIIYAVLFAFPWAFGLVEEVFR